MHVGAVAEGLLDRFALGAAERAGVLGGVDGEDARLAVHAAVKVLGVVAPPYAVGRVRSGTEGSAATVARAGLAVPVVGVVGVNGLFPEARRAVGGGFADEVVGELADLDVAWLEAVDAGGAVLGGTGREDARVGERREEAGQQLGGGFRAAQAEAAHGPVLVPAEPGGEHVEVLAALLGPAQQEGGGGDPGGEGGHARRPAAPHGPAAYAALGEPLVQPGVPDGSAGPQPLQEAAYVAEVAVGAGLGAVGQGDLAGGGAQEVGDQAGDGVRAGEGDADGDGAGELQGAALPGLEAELHDGGERQALGDQFPGRAGAAAAAREQGVHAPEDMQVRRDDGGLDRLAVDHVCDDVGRQVADGDRLLLGDTAGEQGAEGEGVRAAGHVSGAVGGILDGVVEEESLVLLAGRVQLTAGEQLGDGRGGQGCQAGAEITDGVEGATGGALVLLGRAVPGQVDPHEGAVVQRPGPAWASVVRSGEEVGVR